MSKIKLTFLLISLLILPALMYPQTSDTSIVNQNRMQWFRDAKLGIFIHWGIYSVAGIDESWSFFNDYITHYDYMKQLDGFDASSYKPDEWAELIKNSGAKYAVLTTKHHDGVALWKSDFGDLNVVNNTPAGKDLVAPFCKALRKNKIKVGLYYSLLDWSHPDYPNFTRNKKRYLDDSIRWERFTKFNLGQIGEISDIYNPDLVWFDGDWEQTDEMWRAKEIRNLLLEKNGNIIINSRLQGYGDYATPEQGLPVTKPQDDYWELCMTINDSWGYQPNDKNYKSIDQIINIFAQCLWMGGNLLLDIAPKADGTIPYEQQRVLKELGRWISKHETAIYKTNAGLPPGYFYGPSTISADSTIVYLFLPYKPNGQIMLKGINNDINRIWVVGNGTKLDYSIYLKPYWSDKPGLVFIDIPGSVLDENMTVVAVLLDGPLKPED